MQGIIITKVKKPDSKVNIQNSETSSIMESNSQISSRIADLFVTSSFIDLQLSQSISEKQMKFFESAIIHAVSQWSGNLDQETHTTFSSKIKSLLDLKSVLQIVEEVDTPVYLMKGDTEERNRIRTRLFTDGLPPDLAWKFQLLLDIWHQQDPISFPKVKLVLTNIVLIYKHELFTKLYEFFENRVEFDRIISLKDLLFRDQLKRIDTNKINISFFNNHIKIFIKKDYLNLTDIDFHLLEGSKSVFLNNFSIIYSDLRILQIISSLILTSLHRNLRIVIERAQDLGLDENTSNEILDLFTESFVIHPVIYRQDSDILLNLAKSLLLKPSKKSKNIKSDLDILNYILSISDGAVPLEQVLTDWTRYDHIFEIKNTNNLIVDKEYDKFKNCSKPIFKTRYFLLHPEKFHIQILDLSNVRLIQQPDLRILNNMKHLRSLILDNNCRISEFDITKIEFGILKNLEELSLRNCNISKLSKSMFKGALNLKRLILEENPILEIESGCFSDTKLSEIVIDCMITENWSADYLGVLTKNTSTMEDHDRK